MRSLDGPSRALLQRYHFDEATFEALRERLRAGRAGPAHNRIRGDVEPPAAGDVRSLPPPGTEERSHLTRVGGAAIAAGQVGSVILAGGMATRFGGVVKATAPALDDRTFLELKLRDVRAAARRAGGHVPIFLMSSFATDEALREATDDDDDVEVFAQLVSLRLTPEAELFIGDDGRPSPYGPGHGDLTFALRGSGILSRFRAAGGRVLYMSNVDNLTATLEPAVIGAHLESGAACTVEVAPKEPGDRGGAPARVDGRLQIVEAFRFPEGFDQDRIDVFNTNTLLFDAEAIDRDFDLTWFAVDKVVDGRPAVQFERLVGELTAFLPSAFLRVERDGPDARFQPAKDPDELARRLPAIRLALERRGAL